MKFLRAALAFMTISYGMCYSDPDQLAHTFQRPSQTDSRSPCPWINTLANHNYLPRDGKNITIPTMLKAVEDVFNVSSDVVVRLAKLSVLCSKQFDSFNLNDTALHGCIEHDASISRADANVGDNLNFNETLYKTLADKNPGKDFYDIAAAAQVMKERLEFSLATNNATVNTGKEFTFRANQATLYLTVMGDAETARAPKKFVDVVFREERLPWAEGWKKSSIKIDPSVIAAVRPQIMEAAQWNATGGSYANALPIVLAG